MRRPAGPTSAEISAMLEARFADVVARLYPDAVVIGPVAYCSYKSAKDLGSFHVHLHDHGKFGRGTWNRWSESIGGGPLNLVAYALTGAHKGDRPYFEAVQWAKRFLGVDDARPETDAERRARAERETIEREKRERARAETEAERTRFEEQRRTDARFVWRETAPIAGKLAETYLLGRGLPPDVITDPLLRFHPGLEYELDERGARRMFPALVAKASDVEGHGRGIWRIYLDPATGAKAPVPKAKLGMGATRGCAVRIGGDAEHIGVCEGVETALACRAIERMRLPVWPLLGTAGFSNWEPPLFIRRVTIYRDGDAPRLHNGRIAQPGAQAAAALAERLTAMGIEWMIVAPPIGTDFLDLWNATKGLLDAQ